MSTIVPLGVFHSVVEDNEVGSDVTRKNTLVIGNLWAANHDPTTWLDPEEFQHQVEVPQQFWQFSQ